MRSMISWSLGLVLFACSGKEEECCCTTLDADEAIPSTSLYQIDANWTDQANRTRTLADFRGNTTLIAMVFTQCAYACPQLIGDLQAIEAGLSEDELRDTRIVLVTMDTARDTPDVLAAYARDRELAAPRWTLLHGTTDDVQTLAAVLGVKFKQVPGGDFSHSNLITVLDADGTVAHRHEGLNAPIEPTLSAIRRLAQ